MRAITTLCVICLTLAAQLSLAGEWSLFGSDCLDETETRARDYAQCQRIWEVSDNRCKQIGDLLNSAMRQCREEGIEKTKIDARMNRGFKTAGKAPLPETLVK